MGFDKISIGCDGNLTVTMLHFILFKSLNYIGYYFGLLLLGRTMETLSTLMDLT